MADIKNKYGTSNQTLTITLASLANAASRASTAVDNSSTLYQDALVSLSIKTGASGTAATGSVVVYAYGTVDGGTNYTEGATGSDAALTLVSPTNLRMVGLISTPANATTYKAGPFSIAQAFGGVLPERWGIVVQNSTGAALDSTEGSHLKVWQGVLSQVG